VTSSAKEPIESYPGSVYGPAAIPYASQSGFQRLMRNKFHNPANIVPVDLTMNSVIAAAWKTYIDFS